MFIAIFVFCRLLLSFNAKKRCLDAAKESFSFQCVLHQRHFTLFLKATLLPDQNNNADREILPVWSRCSSSWQAEPTSTRTPQRSADDAHAR